MTEEDKERILLFASIALPGLLANQSGSIGYFTTDEKLALNAFDLAEAMNKEFKIRTQEEQEQLLIKPSNEGF